VTGTRARGPAPERSRWARHAAVAPAVLAVLAAIYGAPHAAEWTQARLRRAPFLVEHVEVQGLERIEAAELRDALAPARGVPLVDLDGAAVAAAVAAHPWVAEVTTLRWPPDTLRVRVVEREPLAVVGLGDAAPHAVDRTGTAFAPASEEDGARLVAIALDPPPVVGEPDARLLEALRIAAGLRERGLEVPRRVTLGLPEREASAELRLRGFAPAIFIERETAEAQLDRLAQLLAAHVGPATTARVIDLRFAGRAILWEGS
jgi:hypothetical protein